MDRRQQLDAVVRESGKLAKNLLPTARSIEDAEDAVATAIFAAIDGDREIENVRAFVQGASVLALSSAYRTCHARRVVTGTRDSHGELFDLVTGEELVRVPLNESECETLAMVLEGISCDEAAILCGTKGGTVSMRRTRLLRKIEHYSFEVENEKAS